VQFVVPNRAQPWREASLPAAENANRLSRDCQYTCVIAPLELTITKGAEAFSLIEKRSKLAGL
jgi:hypothetical protein